MRAAKRLLTLKKQYSYDASGKDKYGRSVCVIKLDNSTLSE
jgi:endonuclease YncB( thermonuclease family)